MEIIFTDGTDQRFIHLCHELDDTLIETVGGEKQRAQYNQYNTMEEIHDVVLIVNHGMAVACGSFREYENGVVEIKRVFTKDEYRNRGLGRVCMDKLEERAKEEGYYKCILETGRILEAACHLYETMGYEVIPNYGPYANMNESICMGKRI